MFLVSHSLETRAKEIRSWMGKHPSVSLIVAAVYVEWTMSRAIVGLSRRPNQEVRALLERTYGLDRYRKLWNAEMQHLHDARGLPDLIRDWNAVRLAFAARNVLVHGKDRYTPNMAKPHVDALIAAVSDICAYSLNNGVDINQRLPMRRVKHVPPEIDGQPEIETTSAPKKPTTQQNQTASNNEQSHAV